MNAPLNLPTAGPAAFVAQGSRLRPDFGHFWTSAVRCNNPVGVEDHAPRRRNHEVVRSWIIFWAMVIGYWSFPIAAQATESQDDGTNQIFSATATKPLADVLPAGKWRQVEGSVDRALAWLASQQADDGSFPTLESGQPAVTSLCVLAFLSRGHQPGLGPYGQKLEKAIDFVLSCQRPDGLFCNQPISPRLILTTPSHTASYNHAIAGLMLGEVYGHVTGQRARAVKEAVQKALQFTRALQTRPKELPMDKGGWRYLRLRFDHGSSDSDLSVTSWQLMFLRSARNAEFDVPQEYIDEALEYVMRCWRENEGVFYYALAGPGDVRYSRSMVSAGILSLALSGKHRTHEALKAGDWLLAHPYRFFGELSGSLDRFFYGAYYYSQAAAQLGGHYWEHLFPPLVDAMLTSQSPDGSWPPEPGPRDSVFGNEYSTALAVLSLTPPYQLLPVYQR